MILASPDGTHWEHGAGLIMNSSFNLGHWLRLVMLGCVLGLVYVYITLSFWMPPEVAPPFAYLRAEPRRPVPPFKFSESPMQRELDQVIEAQLRAFRKDDYPKAYQYAASALKAQVSLPAFERMVKTGYPLIARSRSEAFGVCIDNGEIAVVNVGILVQSGRIMHYQYLLGRERAGWRIRGVMETRIQGVTI